MNNIKIAIAHQAAYDWCRAMKKKAKMERMHRHCIECEYHKAHPDTECWWTRSRVTGRTAKIAAKHEYEQALSTIAECERFFLSDWCEYLSGMEKGYLLNRLKREMPDVSYKKK